MTMILQLPNIPNKRAACAVPMNTKPNLLTMSFRAAIFSSWWLLPLLVWYNRQTYRILSPDVILLTRLGNKCGCTMCNSNHKSINS